MTTTEAIVVALISSILLALIIWDTYRLMEEDESGWCDEETFDPPIWKK